jgi:hypothetical protein
MGTKICSKCKILQDLDNFCKDSKSKDSKQSYCKICKSKSINEYYKTNPKKRPKKTKKQLLDNYYKHRVNRNFSRRMRKSLNGLKDGMSWEQLVEYNVLDLKKHLEGLFTEGMSWENYGKWHIDHIIPISSFTITNVNCGDFKTCWSLNNLQPLWAMDNIKKSNNLIK